MLIRFICVFLIALFSFLALASTPRSPTPLTAEYTDFVNQANILRLTVCPQDRLAEYTLIKGILTSKAKEGVWYQCGNTIPKDEWYVKAVEIAEACVYTARPLGVDPVGQLATWQQESRLDPCAIGPHPRNWAIERGLLKAKRNSLSYTKAEVKKVLTDAKFKATFPKVDLGLAQLLHPWFTRGATLDELLSIEGAQYSARELAHRGKMYRSKKPWVYWPGYKSKSRENTINWWVYRVMEIEFLNK